MNAAQTTTGSQRCRVANRAVPAARGSSDELVDRPLDNGQDLFAVLRVEEVLELRTLTHVLPTVAGLLLVGEVRARHQVEKREDPAAFLLAEVALELLIECQTQREVAQAVTHLFGELHE